MSEFIEDSVEYAMTEAAANSCRSTVNGWLWYCDQHDTHGNADTEDEADYMATAHEEWHEYGEDCAVYVAAVGSAAE